MKLRNMKVHIQKAKEENLKVMIGGDMNGHTWELDKCEKVWQEIVNLQLGVAYVK